MANQQTPSRPWIMDAAAPYLVVLLMAAHVFALVYYYWMYGLATEKQPHLLLMRRKLVESPELIRPVFLDGNGMYSRRDFVTVSPPYSPCILLIMLEVLKRSSRREVSTLLLLPLFGVVRR